MAFGGADGASVPPGHATSVAPPVPRGLPGDLAVGHQRALQVLDLDVPLRRPGREDLARERGEGAKVLSVSVSVSFHYSVTAMSCLAVLLRSGFRSTPEEARRACLGFALY